MARVTFSTAKDLRGRVREDVYSKTGNTNYIRNYVKTPNPASTSQRAVRSAFSTSAQTFRTLSQAQQDGWISLGAQMSRVSDLGATRVLSGSQAFSAINNTRQILAMSLLMDAPNRPMPPMPLPDMRLMATQGTGTGGAFSLAIECGGYAGKVIVRATRAVSPGVNKFTKGAFRPLAVEPALSLGLTSLTAAYETLYGAAPLGEKVAVELTPVSDNGFRGAPVVIYAVVTPATSGGA